MKIKVINPSSEFHNQTFSARRVYNNIPHARNESWIGYDAKLKDKQERFFRRVDVKEN